MTPSCVNRDKTLEQKKYFLEKNISWLDLVYAGRIRRKKTSLTDAYKAGFIKIYRNKMAFLRSLLRRFTK